MQKVDWIPVILLGGTTMVTVAMAESTTGIPDYISATVLPLVSGLSPFAIVSIIGVLCCIMTNFMMNSGVGVICGIVGTMIAMQTGINPSVMAVAVSVGANMAYLIPSAMAPIGIAYTSPWCDGRTVFKNGLVAVLASFIAIPLVLFPLGNLVF
jgi:di/tricarboxylate transporter